MFFTEKHCILLLLRKKRHVFYELFEAPLRVRENLVFYVLCESLLGFPGNHGFYVLFAPLLDHVRHPALSSNYGSLEALCWAKC